MLPLQAPVFSILRGLIETRAGIHYELTDLELLATKLSPRARELGFDSLLDYYYYLRYDPKGPQELELLLESLMVHETYFFREAPQLQILVDGFLAPLVATGVRPRVWCCASSTGEEPYTLAMMLGEKKLLGQVEIVASDLSRRVLAHAKEGVYTGRALRATAGTIASRWLEEQGKFFQVAPALRSAIDWRQINLVDAPQVGELGQFDAILCRNVLIYFSDQTNPRVVEQVSAALKPGGLLLVGASESLTRFGTSLDCEERAGSFFYRRAG